MVEKLQGTRIRITGIVQGVGFRPFVYTVATGLGLRGWVRNTSAGVEIEVDGAPDLIQRFIHSLQKDAPPLAQIDHIDWEFRPANGFQSFEILDSQAIADAFQPISPDISVCPDCLRELFHPQDRRYRYPFINCTNCGPRFTIIQDIPYDRPKTTMSSFAMCPDCAAEYADPLNRRFHAQPVACPRCGPRVWLELEGAEQDAVQADPIQGAQALLKAGQILAIKGLGGFHLACDATNLHAVTTLRERKLRVDKPFALMMPDTRTVRAHCYLSQAEQALLESVARPIVILRRRPDSTIAPQVAPGQDTLGIMLPYTPLHYLLFAPAGLTVKADLNDRTRGQPILEALVMTSGNLSEEPIAYQNQEARQRLSALADAFLMHDRPIHLRCDDSVMRVFASGAAVPQASQMEDNRKVPRHPKEYMMPIRRSRGYAPYPVLLPYAALPILATGGELKNTFCITHERYAFLSHHVGDLENFETLASFEEGVRHFERLFRSAPVGLAYDLHPDYLATRYGLDRAEAEGLPAVGVQHHHAHIAACLAENGHDGSRPVIGISFDGTGYGQDGAIWGGEFLIADYDGYRRAAHLRYVPLPGGDRAVKEPWRTALAWLVTAGLDGDESLPPIQHALNRSRSHEAAPPIDALGALRRQIQTGLNSPRTSSMGRLFDAVAALIGIRQTVNYEAQAAIELQALADTVLQSSSGSDPDDAYSFELIMEDPASESQGADAAAVLILEPLPMFAAIVSDQKAGRSPAEMAARFHRGLAQATLDATVAIRKTTGIHRVALSGGVWQNTTLLSLALRRLRQADFDVLIHTKVPCNDGGLALGQAAIAARRLGSLPFNP